MLSRIVARFEENAEFGNAQIEVPVWDVHGAAAKLKQGESAPSAVGPSICTKF